MNYKIVYDASTAGFQYGVIAVVLVMVTFGAVVIIWGSQKIPRTLSILWTSGWLLLGGLGAANVNYQRWQCRQWAKTPQQYDLVEGPVADYKLKTISGHSTEQFQVNGVRFKYSDHDISKGGFNDTAFNGGPIREGLQVRIAYRDGRILKLWVKSTENNQ